MFLVSSTVKVKVKGGAVVDPDSGGCVCMGVLLTECMFI